MAPPASEIVADAKKVDELIDQLATAIARDLPGTNGGKWALIGLLSRGDVLAERLANRLHPTHVGTMDITLYRDDLSNAANQPVVRTTEIPFALDDLDVVLVDDVLMTGRSVRAAMQLLMDFGRPRRVWLAVLVDRGGRELPIAADHVGLKLGSEVGPERKVAVRLRPTDDRDAIELSPVQKI